MRLVDPIRKTPRIIFLFSDTGGGHRSASEAIIEALNLEFPGQVRADMIDLFRAYAPKPLDLAPDIYPPLSRVPDVWGLGYRASDGKQRTRMLNDALWPYVRLSISRLVRENPADLLVSVHPLFNGPLGRRLANSKTPFYTVVTDMVSTHAAWFDRHAEKIVVATEAARQRGLKLGIEPNKLTVVGLPVADRFCRPVGERAALRAGLGWPQDGPAVLLVGGGEGMGPLRAVAEAINAAHLPATLVIIAGRNRKLKEQLEHIEWNMPVRVYGFVREMPDFMRAADILVTKAGPGTICEAFIAELPIILYSRMPGQEDGNVSFVVDEGAGVWAPEPDSVVNALRRWLEHPQERLEAAATCRRLARPQAARQIARLLAQRVGLTSGDEHAHS